MPTKSKVIAVRISGTTGDNTPIYLHNRNTGNRWVAYSLDEGDGQVALADLMNNTFDGNEPTAWISGHVIDVLVIGVGYGSTTITLGNQAEQEVTVTLTTDDGPAVSI